MRLLLFAVCVTLSGCVTYQKCADKFGTPEPGKKVTAEHVLDTTLAAITKPDSIKGGIDADTLIHLVQQLQQVKTRHDSLLFVTQTQNMQIKLWYDRHTNQIKFSATKKADSAEVHLKDTVRVVADCPPAMVFDPVEKLPWYAPAKLWARYQFFAAWVLLALVLIASLYSKFKK